MERTTGSLRRDPFPLRGRTALVTGASRRDGIGHAIACRMAAYGASVYLQHYAPHDHDQDWGADDVDAVAASVRTHLDDGARLAHGHADLAAPGAPEQLVADATSELGHVDVLVCNQAQSGHDGPLGALTAEMLDRHWAVNTRASILLAQAFAGAHDGRPGGSVTFLTSGQGRGPMPGEIAYAAAKAALAGVTETIADQLADRGLRVNTVNPGPVDTGYLGDDAWAAMAPMFPFGRFGEPDDPARLIAWLATDEARWITGQVIESEGGFSRSRS
ncbi:3-oxoacyl-[acyl-carrier protein] reductase [Pseudonocardia sediminis]|uniref:3-oxoacyl-[acyl-carrier protein] reductase n=1 Tax=Pseudonocardia sediminis TaxID=1397368 RepID=A0A4V6MEC3_PSEST|nr:SDR family oxidoreductase [Pseudonocardia sediminis]RZT86960.1 3-oxoacyl-[acyl-carrier protein] reductase [Pseudonocardia sediminis]